MFGCFRRLIEDAQLYAMSYNYAIMRRRAAARNPRKDIHDVRRSKTGRIAADRAARSAAGGFELRHAAGRLRRRARWKTRASEAGKSCSPIGSFKIRPIGNAVLAQDAGGIAPRASTPRARATARSAWPGWRGDWALRATAVVPASAPEAKLEKLRRLGARIDMRPTGEWWSAIKSARIDGQSGVYIDAVRDPASLAGDATIGLEILAQLPDVGGHPDSVRRRRSGVRYRVRGAGAATRCEDHCLRTHERASPQDGVRRRGPHRDGA